MPPSINIFWILISCYGLFFFECIIAWNKQIISLDTKILLSHAISRISIKNIVGIVILGLPLILFYNDWHQLISWPVFNSLFQVLMVFFLLMIAIGISLQHTIRGTKSFSTHKKKNEIIFRSPEISYLIIRVAFLVIYECFFRGLLLSVSVTAFGTAPAIVINIFLYTSIHAFNGRSEMLACVPFGLLVCGTTILYQSILPAIAIHLILALVNEIYLLCFSVPKPKTVSI